MVAAIFLLSLCGAMTIGMPIAFALLVSGVALMYNQGFVDGRVLAQQLIGGADNFPLMAIPFFLLVGELMNAGGVSKRIVSFGMALVGHVRGGMGYVAIIASFIFAGLSGSAIADTAALCAIMVPMMHGIGYDKARSAALIGAAGVIAPILPPSIPFIVFGALSGVSIMKLFMAGIIPGIIFSFSLVIVWWWMCRKMDLVALPRKSFKEILIATKEAAGALVLPFLIIVSLKGGVVTPTEAGVISLAYTLFLCMVVYRTVTLKDFYRILASVAQTTSVIMFLVAAAMISSYMIAVSNIPADLGDLLEPFIDKPVIMMIAVNILVFIVGTAMDLTPTILILTPVLMPIIERAGIDPVYFGVIFVMNNAIGLITPPVGTVLNAACGACGVSMDNIMVKITPFLITETVVLGIMILFPELITAPFHMIFGK